MSQFEFFMAFYGLLLGLGVAELLHGFSNLLRENKPPRLGIVTPLLGVQVLIEMLANFSDAWRLFQTIHITLRDLALPTVIGLLYYVAAVIIVPRHLSEWTSLDDYFDRRRKWITGVLMLANAVVYVAMFPGWLAKFAENGVWIAIYAVNLGWLFGAYTLLMLTRSQRFSVAAILLLMLWYFVFYGPYGISASLVAWVG